MVKQVKQAKQPEKASQKSAAPAKKDGVSKPQVRILKALAALKPGRSLDRVKLAERSNVHINWIIEYVGSAEPVSDFVRGYKKLIPAGFVKANDDPEVGRSYEITPAGRKALAAANG